MGAVIGHLDWLRVIVPNAPVEGPFRPFDTGQVIGGVQRDGYRRDVPLQISHVATLDRRCYRPVGVQDDGFLCTALPDIVIPDEPDAHGPLPIARRELPGRGVHVWPPVGPIRPVILEAHPYHRWFSIAYVQGEGQMVRVGRLHPSIDLDAHVVGHGGDPGDDIVRQVLGVAPVVPYL